MFDFLSGIQKNHQFTHIIKNKKTKVILTAVGFEPTPFRTGA